MNNVEKYHSACAEYAALPLIETPEQQAHADALLRLIESLQADAEGCTPR